MGCKETRNAVGPVVDLPMLLITSAKEVMFSSAFVCLLAGLCKNYSTDFHKVRWKGGTQAMEETIRFWW